MPTEKKVQVFFSRGNWNKSDFIEVKSPRWEYINEWVQEDDYVCNATPDVSDEELFEKYGGKVYSAMVYKEKFAPRFCVSSKMSFDHLMAPLIVIAPELGKSKKDFPEFREHYEIVLYMDGINVWHHTYQDGKPAYIRTAFLNCKYDAKTIYDLKVDVKQIENKMLELEITCGDQQFGCALPDLAEDYYLGIIACEGRNRFYDFQVK